MLLSSAAGKPPVTPWQVDCRARPAMPTRESPAACLVVGINTQTHCAGTMHISLLLQQVVHNYPFAFTGCLQTSIFFVGKNKRQ